LPIGLSEAFSGRGHFAIGAPIPAALLRRPSA
jgi:hypothetical protein